MAGMAWERSGKKVKRNKTGKIARNFRSQGSSILLYKATKRFYSCFVLKIGSYTHDSN